MNQTLIWQNNGLKKSKPLVLKVKKKKARKVSKLPARLEGLPKQCEFCSSFEDIEIIECQYICKNCFMKLGTAQPCETKKELVVYA